MITHIDPVCGMAVDPATAAGQFEYKGTTYYFCNPHCLHKFQSDPEGYLNKPPQPSAMQHQSQPQAQPAMVQLGGKSKSPALAMPVLQGAPSAAATEVDPVCGMKVH